MAASTYNNNGFITRTATVDLSAGNRVKLVAGGVALAGDSAEAIGTVEQPVLANTPVTVRLFNTPGTRFGIAAGAVTVNAAVYASNNGKVAASGDDVVGIALSATSADGDVLEYLPITLLG